MMQNRCEAKIYLMSKKVQKQHNKDRIIKINNYSKDQKTS